jgi:hypothetical protein
MKSPICYGLSQLSDQKGRFLSIKTLKIAKSYEQFAKIAFVCSLCVGDEKRLSTDFLKALSL